MDNLNAEIRKPQYCSWVVNLQCFFKCRMCFIWQKKYDKSQEPTFEQKKRFVQSLRGNVAPDFVISFSGGEPLLDEQLFDLIDVIAAEGYRTNLVTNGYLIDKEMAKKIAGSKLDLLTVSLDGIKPETHDFIRGVDGAYQRAQEAIGHITALRSDGPKLSLLTVMMKPNLDELLPLVEWVNNIKQLESVYFQAIVQPFCQSRDDLWFATPENKYLWPDNKALQIMEKLYELKNKNYKIGNKANHFKAFAKYFNQPNQFLKTIKCNLGDYEFHIDPNGDIFFCGFMARLGNIKRDAIADIWSTERTQEIRNSVYRCRQNCHILVNCYYEDEKISKRSSAG